MNAQASVLSSSPHACWYGGVETKPEEVIVAELAARIRGHVPEPRRSVVDSIVQSLWREYSDARIRDFVPIFVERDALAQLGAHRGAAA